MQHASLKPYVLIVCLSLHAFSAQAFVDASDPLAAATVHWQKVLEDFVNAKGQVDFARLALYPEDLYAYVAFISAYSPTSHGDLFPTADDQLAFYINAYNALSMKGVLDYKIPLKLKGVTRYKFFRVTAYKVGGEHLSLHQLEHNHIRALGDPRVHFALNCLSISAPRLPQKPFSADNLHMQLEHVAKEFLANADHLTLSQKEETLWLSEIFDFYTEDFIEPTKSLIDYVNQYIEPKVPAHYKVRFMPYDWTINQIPKA